MADRSTGRGRPKDRRLTCESVNLELASSSSCIADEEVLVLMRFLLLRIVTLAGMFVPEVESRGDALGVVLLVGGNLERTEWTRSSIFCILPIKPLI